MSGIAIWGAVAVGFAVVVGLFTAFLNGAFLRCPGCGTVGAWRFDDRGAPVAEVDDEGVVVRSVRRQRCRSCGREVERVWSDYGGCEIREIDR